MTEDRFFCPQCGFTSSAVHWCPYCQRPLLPRWPRTAVGRRK